ncbi:MAG: DUF3325 family protein [Noviherbaspirillum sp.]
MKAMLFAACSGLAAWAGMGSLCFRSPNQRHRMGLPQQDDRQRLRFAAAGSAMLAISLLAALAANGASFGIVLWLCQTGILGFTLICALPYSPGWVAQSSRVAAGLAPVLLVAGNVL